MTDSIAKHLLTWQNEIRPDLFDSEDGWVKSVSFNREQFVVTMRVDYDFSFTYPMLSILVPENYPNGSFSVVFSDGSDDVKEYGKGGILQLLECLFVDLEERRNRAIDDAVDGDDDDEMPPTTTPVTAMSADMGEDIFEVVLDEDEYDDDDGGDGSVRSLRSAASYSNIERDIQQLVAMEGVTAMHRGSGIDEIRVYLFFDPRVKLEISEMVASAWGIDLDKYICVALTFSQHYLNADVIPQIDAFQSGLNPSEKTKTQYHVLLDQKTQFGLYWTVQEKLRNHFFKKHWPFSKYQQEVQQKTGKSFMLAVIEETIQIIKSSPQYCIICEQTLPFEGLKPTVCDSPLCVFSHEEYGLGVDLESAIKKYPEIVDMAITMTYAASNAFSSRFNPFNPFPISIEVKLKGPNGTVITHNFLTPTGERDNQKVRAVMDKIPSVEVLSQWIDIGKLKDNCDNVDPLLYSLLRWILASNRSHLKKLAKHEQITEMKTEHQYCLMSSPPAREKTFQELKKQYGSVYAFHGSALGNWHSIMRQGLKNMSGTDGQVNGAAYGSGVYLAPESGTSFSYMHYLPAWKNSALFRAANIGCMAVCEIIKHPSLKGQPNPYYVIPDENLIATRYFLVFTTQTSAAVNGATLTPPKLDWA